eukprot:2236758-Rhodomonas_salina.1
MVSTGGRSGNGKGKTDCSTSPDLLQDAKRDLRDIGAGHIPVHDLKDYTASQRLSEIEALESGVIFCTYTLLLKRLEQLTDWCGPDFDGVLAFDECHKAKSVKVNGEKTTGTATAHAVTEIQNLHPGARVLYVSATGASDPQQLLYATRLGLWGEGTSFPDAASFERQMNEGGAGAMEVLAMELKRTGKYLSRTLSFKDATFKVEKSLEPDFAALYDKAAVFMGDLVRLVCRAGSGSKANLWAMSQRFWLQMLMAAKVKATVCIAKQALQVSRADAVALARQEGKCVVIGLQATGEAAQAGPDDADHDGWCASSAKVMVRNYITKHSGLDLRAPKTQCLLDRLNQLELP